MMHANHAVVDASSNDIDRLTETKRRIYDAEAARYDEKRFRSPAGHFYEDLSNTQIFELLGTAKSGNVLDVATGTGRVAIGLAKRGVNVTGIDVSEGMLERAREKASLESVRSPTFVLGSAAALPFPDAKFDAVVSVRFLHIMPAVQQAPFIAEMVRVLKPGGTLLIELNNAIPHFLDNFLKRDPNVAIWPWEIQKTFAGMPVEIVDLAGIGFPGLARASRYSARICRAVGLALQHGPTAVLGRQLMIKGLKKGSS